MNRSSSAHRAIVSLFFAAAIGATPPLLRAQDAPALGGTDSPAIFRSGFEARSTFDSAVVEPARDARMPADALPRIGLRLAHGTVDAQSWRLVVDDVDVTASSERDGQHVRFTPQTPLREGVHTVVATSGSASVSWTFVTASLPVLHGFTPVDVASGERRPQIGVAYSDVGAGIDAASVRLSLDGADVTSAATIDAVGARFEPAAALADGEHAAEIRVADRAGNLATTSWSFEIGEPPSIDISSPTAGLLRHDEPLRVEAMLRSPQGTLDLSTVRLRVGDDDVTSEAVVTASGASTAELSYDGDPLPIGEHVVHLEIRDAAGLLGWAAAQVGVDQAPQHAIELLDPPDGSEHLEDRVRVRVRVVSTQGPAIGVDIAGEPATDVEAMPAARVYSRVVDLVPGDNAMEAVARFADGVERRIALRLVRVPDLGVVLTSPLDWSTLGALQAVAGPVPGGATDLTGAVQRPVVVTGTTTYPVLEVRVNQQTAQLAADGRSFTFPNFFLHEGTNLLGVVATDVHQRIATTQATVYVDQTAPLLGVESPSPDATTSGTTVDVRGIVNDAVEGRYGVAPPRVTVVNPATGEQRHADAFNLGYLVRDVPLAVGANRLAITALDAHGNARTQELTVVRTSAGASRLVKLRGDDQRGSPQSGVGAPLVVQAIDAEGLPLRGREVRFDVVRGTGSIRLGSTPTPGAAPLRNLEATTDGDGLASVHLTLGRDARPGSDVVRATLEGTAEDVVFTASAEPGAAARIGVYGASGTQYVAKRSAPVEALMAQVLDAADNPTGGVPVEFRIDAGDAGFVASAPGDSVSEGGRVLHTASDRNGIAVARPIAGDSEGNVVVKAAAVVGAARIEGAVYQLAVLAHRNGDTAMAGVVLDHDGRPLQGVRLSIARTPLSVVTDAAGGFHFDAQVPAGKIDLFVDGRDLRFERGGAQFEYPALHFETAVVAGQVNQLPHPIFLPPVEISRAVMVGGDQDVLLTLPGVEGFEMRVRANSVTFPDGARVGPLVVNAVHADRLPMVPPILAARFAGVGWTIQPTGTRFDPPIEVRIPNTDGLAPGRTLPIVQWDHDLAVFVPMGHGTVTEDGTAIVSDAGSGITKAGWGGGGPPPPPDNTACGPAPTCTECEQASTNADGCAICIPRELRLSGAANMCLAPKCRLDAIEGSCIAAIGEAETYRAILPAEAPDDPPNDPDKITWTPGQHGTPGTGTGVQFSVTFGAPAAGSSYASSVSAVCSTDSAMQDDLDVDVAKSCATYAPIGFTSTPDSTLANGAGGDIGRAVHQWVIAKLRACVGDDQWQHRFDAIELKIDTDVDYGSRTIISSAQDPDLTAGNCRRVLRDLTPSDSEYGTLIAPYVDYVPDVVVQAHEAFHHSDYEAVVVQPLLAWMQQHSEQLPATQCKVENPYATVVAAWRAKRDALSAAFDAGDQHETRAYDLKENPMLEQLRNDIRARATAEQWHQDCR